MTPNENCAARFVARLLFASIAHQGVVQVPDG